MGNTPSTPANVFELVDKDVVKLFRQYDLDGSGEITIDEIVSVFKQKGLSPTDQQIRDLFSFADVDGSQTISLDEFRKAIRTCIKVKRKFKKLDVDKSGYLDISEITGFVQKIIKKSDKKAIAKLVAEADLNNDGKISFDEFARLWFQYKSPEFNKNTSIDKQEDSLKLWMNISSEIPIIDGLTGFQVKSKYDTLPIRLILGGLSSGTATMFTNPVDIIKTKMQLNSTKQTKGSMITTFLTLIKKPGGILNLWNGLSASLLRVACYSSTRLALYSTMKDFVEIKFGVGKPGSFGDLGRKALAGCMAGGVAATIANPVEVVKVRIQADKGRYINTRAAFSALVKEEGLSGMFSGVIPHVLRGAAITASQISTYDHIKNYLVCKGYFSEGLTVHFASSMVAGLITTTCSNPFDVVKTRVMNAGKTRKLNMFGAVTEIWVEAGFKGFFRGWLPNYTRLGPHTVITLVVFEKLRAVMGLHPV